MRTYLISDTHFNHDNIATYCERPADFTELIVKRWNERVKNEDLVIHLGDVAIGNRSRAQAVIDRLNGRKILVRGNHDRQHTLTWWMLHGFDFACDAMIFRGNWLTHKPSAVLPERCNLNIHGHLHNIWHGFHPNNGENHLNLRQPWQRLFSVEYTNYCPIEFEEFLSHPDKYQSCGPKQ